MLIVFCCQFLTEFGQSQTGRFIFIRRFCSEAFVPVKKACFSSRRILEMVI